MMRINPEAGAGQPDGARVRHLPHAGRRKTVAEIAETLNLSAKTVSNYHYLIKSKLGVSSDIELVHLAMRLKIIDPDKVQTGE